MGHTHMMAKMSEAFYSSVSNTDLDMNRNMEESISTTEDSENISMSH